MHAHDYLLRAGAHTACNIERARMSSFAKCTERCVCGCTHEKCQRIVPVLPPPHPPTVHPLHASRDVSKSTPHTPHATAHFSMPFAARRHERVRHGTDDMGVRTVAAPEDDPPRALFRRRSRSDLSLRGSHVVCNLAALGHLHVPARLPLVCAGWRVRARASTCVCAFNSFARHFDCAVCAPYAGLASSGMPSPSSPSWIAI